MGYLFPYADYNTNDCYKYLLLYVFGTLNRSLPDTDTEYSEKKKAFWVQNLENRTCYLDLRTSLLNFFNGFYQFEKGFQKKFCPVLPILNSAKPVRLVGRKTCTSNTRADDRILNQADSQVTRIKLLFFDSCEPKDGCPKSEKWITLSEDN